MMGEFAKYEHIQKLRNEVVPVVETFSSLIGKFQVDNRDMKNCIRNFDEVLCEKANKSAIFKMEQWIEDDFVSKKEWNSLKGELLKNDEQRQVQVA